MSMDRRRFIRLAGGGAVAVTLGACDSALPPEAIAAWQGPGEQTDVRRWLVGHALLAPHSHNLQSWLVDLGVPGEITLFIDRSRLLPQTDPHSRQMMMSQGCFIELLDLAAREKGLRAQIELFPRGAFGPETVPIHCSRRSSTAARTARPMRRANPMPLPWRRSAPACGRTRCESVSWVPRSRRRWRGTAASPAKPGASSWSRRAR
jgi:hypothetical protein